MNPLIALLGDEQLRAEGIAALRAIGKPSVPPLSDALLSEDPLLRKGALQALGAFGPEAASATTHLISQLVDADLRNEVMLTLGKIGKSAVPELMKSVNSEITLVRHGAIQALGYIGPQAAAALELLTEVARDNADVTARELAYVAVRRIKAK